jgi:hypothetical protein
MDNQRFSRILARVAEQNGLPLFKNGVRDSSVIKDLSLPHRSDASMKGSNESDESSEYWTASGSVASSDDSIESVVLSDDISDLSDDWSLETWDDAIDAISGTEKSNDLLDEWPSNGREYPHNISAISGASRQPTKYTPKLKNLRRKFRKVMGKLRRSKTTKTSEVLSDDLRDNWSSSEEESHNSNILYNWNDPNYDASGAPKKPAGYNQKLKDMRNNIEKVKVKIRGSKSP